MKLYAESPKDWKDLQNRAARLLSEISYKTEIEKDIQTVRGIVNIDVYADNNTDTPETTILCECKYWSNPVPKTIVHAFRTTVADFGANYGIIISKAGFQSGSYDAIKNTNILLLDWNGFQDYFKIKWIKRMQFIVSQQTKPLYDYVSAGFLVFFKKEYNSLSESDLETFEKLNSKYFNVAFYSSNMDYADFQTNDFSINIFETIFKQAQKDFNKIFASIENYHSFLVARATEGIDEFDLLFKQKLRRTANE